ncbi:uncharacterized protein LOC121377966 [Gigantopelta aegis]|uniref:uncharacterized protein LOC121377966 n=1 Tax=Gigantopelta aegis TaxID=1735272 RepID=UPI001B88C6F3|nr:uncharacterized protein LOC121377966 [Gigantopelta aegis]
MRRLQRYERLRAVDMLQVDTTQRIISRFWARYRQIRNVTDRPRSGRPRTTTPVHDRFIWTYTLRNRGQSANQISREVRDTTGVTVSGQTIRNRLHRSNIHACRPYVTPHLTARHTAARRQWYTHRRHWVRVMFSDKSRFTLDFHDRRQCVWRGRNERYANIRPHDRFGEGSVMVWGGITITTEPSCILFMGGLLGSNTLTTSLHRSLCPSNVRLNTILFFRTTTSVLTGV